MNHLEREIQWLEEHAKDIQSRYPKAKRLPEYLDLLSRIAEKRKAELQEIRRFVSNINDPLVKEIAAYRLLEGMTYNEISELVQYSSRHVQQLWKPYREQFGRVHMSRIKLFLNAIINNTKPPEPIFRIEYYLARIAGEDVDIPEPIYRIEKYLAKICGEDIEIPSPIYREEFWLAKICGMNVEPPEPVFRIEYRLKEWADRHN